MKAAFPHPLGVRVTSAATVPNGCAELWRGVRPRQLIRTGRATDVLQHYQPGDLICVSPADFEAVKAATRLQ